jgi:hypothetical protein
MGAWTWPNPDHCARILLQALRHKAKEEEEVLMQAADLAAASNKRK